MASLLEFLLNLLKSYALFHKSHYKVIQKVRSLFDNSGTRIVLCGDHRFDGFFTKFFDDFVDAFIEESRGVAALRASPLALGDGVVQLMHASTEAGFHTKAGVRTGMAWLSRRSSAQ